MNQDELPDRRRHPGPDIAKPKDANANSYRGDDSVAVGDIGEVGVALHVLAGEVGQVVAEPVAQEAVVDLLLVLRAPGVPGLGHHVHFAAQQRQRIGRGAVVAADDVELGVGDCTVTPAGLKTGATKAIPLGFAIAKGCSARHNNGRCQTIPTQPL